MAHIPFVQRNHRQQRPAFDLFEKYLRHPEVICIPELPISNIRSSIHPATRCVEYDDPTVTGETFRRMGPGGDKDPYDIESLCRSIRANGWQPVDSIFVQKLKGEKDRYVVLEGNRRLTAINRLLADQEFKKSPTGLSLRKIAVLEILNDGQDDQTVKNQITYLLGVRHHGSLKRWSAYAQAANVFSRYEEIAQRPDQPFAWDEDVANKVASSLSIPVKTVKSRLRVFIAMRQLSAAPEVADGPGEVRDRHYSLVEEGLKATDLRDLLKQDELTFSLTPETVNHFIRLCHFDVEGRAGSPIKDPREWIPLGKILADQDKIKSAANFKLVVEQNISPSIVWADRSAELRTPTWESWLERLKGRLTEIPIAGPFGDADAIDLIKRLRDLLAQLKKSTPKQK